MKELRAELQNITTPRDRWIRGLLLTFQRFKFTSTGMSDMHESRGQERMENCAKENDRSDQVKRVNAGAVSQLLHKSGYLIVVIVFEWFRKTQLGMSRIGSGGSTSRLDVAAKQNDHQEKSESSHIKVLNHNVGRYVRRPLPQRRTKNPNDRISREDERSERLHRHGIRSLLKTEERVQDEAREQHARKRDRSKRASTTG